MLRPRYVNGKPLPKTRTIATRNSTSVEQVVDGNGKPVIADNGKPVVIEKKSLTPLQMGLLAAGAYFILGG